MPKLVKFEIPAEDLNRAGEFYKKVFGWNPEKYPGSEDYLQLNIVEAGEMGESKVIGAINGGIQRRSARCVMPTFVIQGNDIDMAIEKIKDKGGKIVVEKQDMNGKGFYAQFEDPEGRRFGLFQIA